MKQPRIAVYAIFALALFLGGKLLASTDGFYAVKWGEFIAIAGVAIVIALVLERCLEFVWRHAK